MWGDAVSLVHAMYCPLHNIAYIGPSPECNVVSEFPSHPAISTLNSLHVTFLVQDKMACHATGYYPSRGTSSVIWIKSNTSNRSLEIHHLRFLNLQSLHNDFP